MIVPRRVNGKNGVSPEMAIRLSKAFGGSPEVWLVDKMEPGGVPIFLWTTSRVMFSSAENRPRKDGSSPIASIHEQPAFNPRTTASPGASKRRASVPSNRRAEIDVLAGGAAGGVGLAGKENTH